MGSFVGVTTDYLLTSPSIPQSLQKYILWAKAREGGSIRPSLDLDFAGNKSLVDNVTGTTLVDHNRASSGTYVGSDGLIKTATTNLLTYSNTNVEFSNGAAPNTWTSGEIAPDGTATAKICTTNYRAFIEYSASGTANKPITYSVFLKATSPITRTLALKKFISDDILATKTIDITTDWQRFDITATSDTSDTDGCRIEITGGIQNISAWGAQLEQSSTVGEYIPTTITRRGAPRFDHDPETGESLGLLMEEDSQNLLLRSEEFNDASWTPTGLLAFGSGSTANAIVAPDGTMTADLLTESTSTGFHEVRQSINYESGVTYTWSVFVKSANGARNLEIILATAAFPGNPYVVVNPATGAIINSSDINAKSQEYSNGWYRVYFSATADATAANQTYFRLVNGTSDNYEGDGTSGIYLWGAQLEEGSFPTSYMPSDSGQGDRAADVASISGSNYTSWANNSAGTIFTDSKVINSTSQTQTVYHFDGPSYDVSLRQPQLIGDKFRANIGNVFTLNPGTGNTLSSGASKAAVAYTTTTGRLQVGAVSDEVTMAGALDATQLFIGTLGLGTHLNGTVKRFVFWPARLPNETLSTITQ